MIHKLSSIDPDKVLPEKKCIKNPDNGKRYMTQELKGYNRRCAEEESLAIEIDTAEIIKSIKIGYNNSGVRYSGTIKANDRLWTEIENAIASNKQCFKLVKLPPST